MREIRLGSWGGVGVALVSLTLGCTGDEFTTDDGAGATGATTSTGGTGAASGGGGAGGRGGSGGAGGGGGGAGGGGGVGLVGGSGDCADSDYCVPAPPGGWQGPFVITNESPSPGSCGGAFPTQIVKLVSSPSSADVTCSDCNCGDPNGQSCTASANPGSAYTAASCGGSSDETVPVLNGACQALSATTHASVEYEAGTLASGGSCAPSGGNVTSVPSAYDVNVVLCADQAAPSCDNDGRCLPLPTSPYQTTFCVFKGGDQECPSSAFSVKYSYNAQGTDSRSCTQCTCTAPAQGSECNWSFNTYSSPGCDTKVGEAQTGQCQNVSLPANGSMMRTEAIPVGCAPDGGEPHGAVTLGEPGTVCCIDVSN